MKIVCSASSCKYSSEDEDSSNITFISFPNSDTAAAWAHNCGRPDLIVKAMEDLHTNHYICSDHIEDQFFISKTNPIIIAEGAIPTIFQTSMDSNNIATKTAKDQCRDTADSDRSRESIDIVDVCQSQAPEEDVRTCDYREPAYSEDQDVTCDINFGDATEVVDGLTSRLPVTLTNICRICGRSIVDGTEIFEENGLNMGLKEKIILHTPISVDPDDSMPSKVCCDCCKKLEATHSLVVTCLRTDIRLRRLLNASGTVEYDSKFEGLLNACSIEISNEINSHEVEHRHELSSNVAKNVLPSKFDCEWNDITSNIALEQSQIPLISESASENPSNLKSSLGYADCFEKPEKSCEEPLIELACRNCDKIFANKTDLENHESSHVTKVNTISSKRRCGHCSASFETRKELQTHIAENHDDDLLFKCGICEKSYGKWSSLDVHEATHRHDKPYLCDLCGKSFKHSNNLRGHKRIHLEESKKKRHVCDICGGAFRSRFHLREHANQHNGNKPYACEECGKAFYKRIQLRQHRLSHGTNKHACPICGATFNRRGNMNSHLKRHDKTEGMYTCSVCKHKCKSMSELKMHRKQHTADDIMESIRLKTVEKTLWQCKICEKLFPKRAILLNHENTHNGDRMKVECDKCGKKLANKSSLRYHEKSMHSNERPHMCQFCGEAFVSKEARLIHERIHTGERPYVCKICNMQYRCSSNLSQHMKIHSSIRPHACQYCEKTFTRKGALNVHERIHTGHKPFVCEICNRSFSQKNDMLKHTKTHRGKTTQCDKCDKIFDTKTDILKHLDLHERTVVEDSIVTEYAEPTEPMGSYQLSIHCPDIGEAEEFPIA